jgi:hypothetical protein
LGLTWEGLGERRRSGCSQAPNWPIHPNQQGRAPGGRGGRGSAHPPEAASPARRWCTPCFSSFGGGKWEGMRAQGGSFRSHVLNGVRALGAPLASARGLEGPDPGAHGNFLQWPDEGLCRTATLETLTHSQHLLSVLAMPSQPRNRNPIPPPYTEPCPPPASWTVSTSPQSFRSARLASASPCFDAVFSSSHPPISVLPRPPNLSRPRPPFPCSSLSSRSISRKGRRTGRIRRTLARDPATPAEALWAELGLWAPGMLGLS